MASSLYAHDNDTHETHGAYDTHCIRDICITYYVVDTNDAYEADNTYDTPAYISRRVHVATFSKSRDGENFDNMADKLVEAMQEKPLSRNDAFEIVAKFRQ